MWGGAIKVLLWRLDGQPTRTAVDVERLYPPPSQVVALRGLYLSLGLYRLGRAGAPFVFANFLSSLDGRIALEDSASRQPYLPQDLTSPNDFRLFLELHAQADCLITHGGYLRALAEGRLGNILQVGLHPAGSELADWRQAQGLARQPDVLVASGSLAFPDPRPYLAPGQKVLIATGDAAEPERVESWYRAGHEVIIGGRGRKVEGAPLVRALARRGYVSLYLIAGPDMLETMLRDSQLHRLFLTYSHLLMGGETFRTKIQGPPLEGKGRLRLRSLYYDAGNAVCGQFFAQFDVVSNTTTELQG